MQRHQIENIVPGLFTLLSIYLLTSFPLRMPSLLLIIIGLVVWWMGKITLGDAFSAMPQAKLIVRHGIYTRIRHPIYLGISTMLLGYIILLQNAMITLSCVILIAGLIARAYWEEKIMIKRFGEEYATYKEKTWF